MALIGSDFDKFPMGGAWEGTSQTIRDQYIRLAISRLTPYGVTDGRDYSEAEEGALAIYVRRLFDAEGIGEIEPPEFVTQSLDVPLLRTPAAIPFSGQVISASGFPAPPANGTFVLTAQNGRPVWLAFPLPDDLVDGTSPPPDGDYIRGAKDGSLVWALFPPPKAA